MKKILLIIILASLFNNVRSAEHFYAKLTYIFIQHPTYGWGDPDEIDIKAEIEIGKELKMIYNNGKINKYYLVKEVSYSRNLDKSGKYVRTWSYDAAYAENNGSTSYRAIHIRVWDDNSVDIYISKEELHMLFTGKKTYS